MSAEICYNAINLPVKVTDADGVVTEYTYSDFGLVERVARKDGADVLSSLSVTGNGKYSAAVLTAFGENDLTTQPPNHQTFFTGNPFVEGLGHAFLMRNYRAGLAKWQSADPMGYPMASGSINSASFGPIYGVDFFTSRKVLAPSIASTWEKAQPSPSN